MSIKNVDSVPTWQPPLPGTTRVGRDPLASIVPGTLVAIAAVHAAWALGWRWPGGSDQALADHVVGHGARLPPDWLTALVAGTLVAGAAIVRAGAGGAGGRVRQAAWGVAGVLLARGAVYPPIDLAGGVNDTYARLDLAIYSPLCLALGAGTVRLLRRAPVTP
jgi:hypothetical protein